MPKKTIYRRLSIGIVIDDGLDKPDGVQQSVLTHGQWLIEQGHHVFYIAGETKSQKIPNLYSVSKNLKVRFNGNFLNTPLPASRKRIKQILKTEKPDILYVQMPYSPFLAARVIKAAPKSVTIIGQFHILPFDKLTRYGTKLLGMFLGSNLKKFDHFFSVSKPAQEFAKFSFGIDSEILPNPVNLTEFMPKANKKPAGPCKIVYVGRLTARKGCMELLQAINVLRNDHPACNFKLHICGDGYLKKQLEEYILDNQLSKYVVLHGHVSHADKINHLQSADIAIFPSLSGESFGIVLIEAMAAKAGVVLAGDNPGYRSVLTDFKECLFNPSDANELARRLNHFIQNKNERNDIHRRQQKLVKGYDISIVGKKFLLCAIDCKNIKNKK